MHPRSAAAILGCRTTLARSYTSSPSPSSGEGQWLLMRLADSWRLVAVGRALRRWYHDVALRSVDLAGFARHVAQHLHRGFVRQAQRNRPLFQAYLVLETN